MSVNEKLTAIGDAIRTKTGGTELLTLDAMASEIEGIQAGGGDNLADELITRTVAEVSSNALKVGEYAFYYARSLTSANFPNATLIESSGFSNCGLLASVSFPKLETIHQRAFEYCSALKSVDFPSVTRADNYAFFRCEALQSASFPSLTKAGGGMFEGCSQLVSVNLPNATTIDASFKSCTALKVVDLPAATKLGSNAFRDCTALEAVILRSNTVCTMESSYTFYQSSVANGTGYVYVPDELVDSYKAATNWSTIASQIKPLSEYAG